MIVKKCKLICEKSQKKSNTSIRFTAKRSLE